MTTYGILVVDPAWDDQTSAPLDKATVQHNRAALGAGTHALIYVREPVEALVAEAILTGGISEIDSAPPDAHPAPTIPATNTERGLNVTSTPTNAPSAPEEQQSFGVNYRVPLEIKRHRLLTAPIPLSRIKVTLGAGFAVFDDEWIPLDEADYHTLVREWEV